MSSAYVFICAYDHNLITAQLLSATISMQSLLHAEKNKLESGIGWTVSPL